MTPARRRLLLKLGLTALAAAGAAAWSAVPVTVQVHRVARATIVVEALGVGTLEARVAASVGSKIAGRLAALEVDQGDRVEARQVVARLEDEDVLGQVEVARADEAAAAAGVDRARAELLRADAVAAAGRRERQRVLDLLDRQVASRSDADAAEDAARIAEAGQAAARGALAEAERRLTAAQRALGYQEARLAETVIRAPFDGAVTRRLREPGDVVVPGSTVLTLIGTASLWLRAWVDETELGGLALGQPARVVFRAAPDAPLTGRLARIGLEVDRETRELLVDVALDALPPSWAVGQRVEAWVEVGRAVDAVALPARLLARADGAPGVFVRDGARARWRPVTLGLEGRGLVEVTAGLAPGDEVLERADGRPLRDGARVAAP